MAKSKNEVFDSFAADARDDYDLTDRLRGIVKREKIVTVYTDEVAGEALGGVEKFYAPNTKLVAGVRRWGVIGEQDELSQEIKAVLEQDEVPDEQVAELKARAAKLQKKADELRAKLEESAMVYKLRALPELIMKTSRREAFRNLNLRPKGGLTDQEGEDAKVEYLAIVLSNSVFEWVDRQDGVTRTSLSLANARALQEYLLPEEWDKLEGGLDELQARKAIGNQETDDLDF